MTRAETSNGAIETKLRAITNTSTEEDLNALKGEISGCLSSEKIASLKAIVDAKNDVNDETKDKLKALLIDCVPVSESSFESVFSGAQSEMFSAEGVQKMRLAIDGSFDAPIYKNLDPKYRENIRLAMADKLLHDPEIQKLFNMKIEIVDILGNMVKKDAPKDSKTVEDDKKDSSVTASISQMDSIMTTIATRLAIATQPLSDLLKKNPNPKTLLSNPKAIAAYTGGEISPDIEEMKPDELRAYIASLNGDVRKIDEKVFPMEEIKEKGMNFLANAPDFMVNFFKWLLSFDFIAKFFGYPGTEEERNALFDEERRQRRSLLLLKEFGKVHEEETGKLKNGRHSGEIKMLEGKDLSLVKHKNLINFFKFTKEQGLDMDASFWSEIFNEGKVAVKGEKGEKDTVFELSSKITERDLDKNFEGLYKKLNELQDESERRNKEEVNKVQEEKQKTEKDLISKQEQDQKEKLASEKVQLEKTAVQMTQYENVTKGTILNPEVLGIIGTIPLTSFFNGTYKDEAKGKLANNPNKEAILGVLATYVSILSNEKAKTFINGIPGEKTLQTLSFQRRNLLASIGYTDESIQKQNAKVLEISAAEEKIKMDTERTELIAKRNDTIIKVISEATSFPVSLPKWDDASLGRAKMAQIDYPVGKISYDAQTKSLSIGDIRFSLSVKPYKKWGLNITDARITDIGIDKDSYKLKGRSDEYNQEGDPVLIKKIDMSKLILALLDGSSKMPDFAQSIEFKKLS